MREYKNQNRYFSYKFFIRTLVNGEKHEWLWLMYSESTGNIFCFVCMLFNDNSSGLNPFVKNEFSNWKKSDEKISGHENSSVHRVCTMKWLHRLKFK